MSRRTPMMRSVILPNANQNYVLLTLLRALDPQIPRKVLTAQLQLASNAGAANLYIGNPDTLSPTDLGVELVASQAFSIPSMESNLILLDDIALRTDTPGVRVNISVVTR